MKLPQTPGLHPEFSYHVDYVGNERQPVLVIDNFIANAESLVDSASSKAFNTEKGFYPGIRFPAPELYIDTLGKRLGALICSVFELPTDVNRYIKSVFSLVVTPPHQLLAQQSVPHSDSANMSDIASVHFLCGAHQGGTSLYRHRATGFEYVDDSRLDQYRKIIEEQEKMPDFPTGYMNGSNELFEQIASYDAAFNRIIMYRCTSLHSGNIAPSFTFDSNPRTGRLSINTFIFAPK